MRQHFPQKHMSRRVVLAFFSVCFLLKEKNAFADQSDMLGDSESVFTLLLCGIVAYFLVKLFRSRQENKDDNLRNGQSPTQGKKTSAQKVVPLDKERAAREMWDYLSSEKNDASEAPNNFQGTNQFDTRDFLEGAKVFFSRYHQAKDEKDFDSIKAFLSDDVYADAIRTLESSSSDTPVAIMLLDARLLDIESVGHKTVATVRYDGQLRKGQSGNRSEPIKVVWEFSRDESVADGLWTLDKINKVDQ